MTLFDAATSAAMASVEAHASPAWLEQAEYRIRMLTAGSRFIGEEIVDRLAELGYVTADKRAMGPVLVRMAKAGVIWKTGEFRPAKSSHNSPKPIWERSR